MPTKWYNRKLKEGKLTVFNDAGAWKGIVKQAVNDFNKLQFGVTLDYSDSHITADIVVRYSLGSGQDKDFSWAKANFDAEVVHGQTSAKKDSHGRVEKAVIFLPGKLKNIKDDLKGVVTVHELIHACGLVDEDDHDPEGGVMYAKVQLVNGKLQEPPGEGKTIQGMPPIRIGNWTKAQMAYLWTEQSKN
jgi:hypothetical protein